MTVHRPTPGQLRVYWLALTGLSVAMLIGLACAVVLGLSRLLDLLSPVLWPLALAAVVACLLSPLVDWMEKRKVPRTRAILLVFVVVFALVAGVLASLIPQVVVETQQLIVKVPEYSNKLQHRIAGVLAHPPEILVRFLPAPVTTGIAGNGTAVNGADPEQALTSALSLLAGHWSGLGTWLFSQSDKVAPVLDEAIQIHKELFAADPAHYGDLLAADYFLSSQSLETKDPAQACKIVGQAADAARNPEMKQGFQTEFQDCRKNADAPHPR